MPSVLGVPLSPSPTVAITGATSPELLLAFVNTLIWLLISLLLCIKILENRRIGAQLARQLEQLENKRRVHEELVRSAREGRPPRERQPLEQIPEVGEAEDRDAAGFEVVPGRRVVFRNEGSMEQHLRKALIEELPDVEDDGRFESEEDDELQEALEDEFLEQREMLVDDGEDPREEGDSDDGLEVVRVPTNRVPDREGSPFGRW